MLDRHTFALIDEWPHVMQSIEDILTTPIGTRVMRREYGSELHDLIGRPMTPAVVMAVYTATAQAIAAWEPRFQLAGVEIGRVGADGRMDISIYGLFNGQPVEGAVLL